MKTWQPWVWCPCEGKSLTARVSREVLPFIRGLSFCFFFFFIQCLHLQWQYKTARSVGVRKMPLSCKSRSQTSCVASVETNISIIFPVLFTELEVEDNHNARKQWHHWLIEENNRAARVTRRTRMRDFLCGLTLSSKPQIWKVHALV